MSRYINTLQRLPLKDIYRSVVCFGLATAVLGFYTPQSIEASAPIVNSPLAIPSPENDNTVLDLIDDHVTMPPGEESHITLLPFNNDHIDWSKITPPFTIDVQADPNVNFGWNKSVNLSSDQQGRDLTVQLHEPPEGSYGFTYSVTKTDGALQDEAHIYVDVKQEDPIILTNNVYLPVIQTTSAANK